jgi:hypothetical protein
MFLLFSALIAAAAGVFRLPWTLAQTKVADCGAGKSLFTIRAVSLDPAQPVPNQNVSLNLDYSVPDGLTVTGGEATYSATYNFIPLTSTVEPLCNNIPCPLSSGSYINTSYMIWPSGLSGSLVSKVTWVDTDSRLLLCMSITTRF